jgi:hypothetical protein
MKSVEIVLRRGRGFKERDGGVNLEYVACLYENIPRKSSYITNIY